MRKGARPKAVTPEDAVEAAWDCVRVLSELLKRDEQSMLIRQCLAAVNELRADLRRMKPADRAPTTAMLELTDTDRENDYAFGCEGLMTREQAALFLAISVDLVDDLVNRGQLRRGKMPPNGRRTFFCRRSVRLFAQQTES